LQNLKGKKLLVNFEFDGKIILRYSFRKVVCRLGQGSSGDGPVVGPLITRMTLRVL
jgi:hypothetical protein